MLRVLSARAILLTPVAASLRMSANTVIVAINAQLFKRVEIEGVRGSTHIVRRIEAVA